MSSKCANCDNEASLVDNTPSANSVVYCSACSPKDSKFISPIIEEAPVVVEVVDENNKGSNKTRTPST